MQRALLQKLFKSVDAVPFEVTYWDGATERYGPGEPSFRLVFHSPVSYRRVIRDPVLAFGEAYMDGVIDFSGSLVELLRAAQSGGEAIGGYRAARRLAQGILSRWSRPVSLRKQQEDVQYHYDLGNRFYSLWLDETMSYSCAYFQRPEDSLGQAQVQKIEHVLKKLQLRPGESLLDIGSGWGSLMFQAARKYGVKAMGITLSQEQLQETRRRSAELGLGDRVEVELMDYRVLAGSGRTFDKVASVGMFEHVGQANYHRFMRSLQRLLKPGGLGLLHTITHAREGPVNSWISKYIFPGGHLPSLREVLWMLPEYDFHVLDVESLRLHYAMTLDRWLEGFEKHADAVRDMYGDRFVRMWRLYLGSSAASFRVSGLDVHQILFSRGLNNSLPLTRRHLYT